MILVIFQLLQLAEGSLWSRWSQSRGRCTRAGQKLEHRKHQLSRRQVYFTMGVEHIVRSVVENLTSQPGLFPPMLLCVHSPLQQLMEGVPLPVLVLFNLVMISRFVILFIHFSSGGKIAAQLLRTSY